MPVKKNIGNKAETTFRLSVCVFKLESSHGHLKWKVTDLVRKAGVSRSLVYRYFGSSKEEVLMSALRVFTSEFYGFSERGKIFTLPQRIERARAHVFENPEAILFYQTWRARKSWLQEEFIAIENKFQRKLKKLFPSFDTEQIMVAHACIHGLITAPFLTPKQALEICRNLESRSVLSEYAGVHVRGMP